VPRARRDLVDAWPWSHAFTPARRARQLLAAVGFGESQQKKFANILVFSVFFCIFSEYISQYESL
jgi:hypothetical protein